MTNEPNAPAAKGDKRIAAADAALAEIEAYFADRADVIDSMDDDGQPAPNIEMTMQRECEIVRAALSTPEAGGEAVAWMVRSPKTSAFVTIYYGEAQTMARTRNGEIVPLGVIATPVAAPQCEPLLSDAGPGVSNDAAPQGDAGEDDTDTNDYRREHDRYAER